MPRAESVPRLVNANTAPQKVLRLNLFLLEIGLIVEPGIVMPHAIRRRRPGRPGYNAKRRRHAPSVIEQSIFFAHRQLPGLPTAGKRLPSPNCLLQVNYVTKESKHYFLHLNSRALCLG
jgi:hypothetical protein